MYSPVRTLQRYILLSPWASGLEYVSQAEYPASTAKYTPSPNAVAENEMKRNHLKFHLKFSVIKCCKTLKLWATSFNMDKIKQISA